MITSYAVWCWAGSVQWVYQSVFTENSQLLLLLLEKNAGESGETELKQ